MKNIDPLNHPSLPVPSNDDAVDETNEAADLIRSKLSNIYGEEPDAVSEVIEAEQVKPTKRSKHQKFMANLAESGKPFAQIQTEWHEYYTGLPDNEKHEVWNEFYENQNKPTKFKAAAATPQNLPDISKTYTGEFSPPEEMTKKAKPSSVADIKKQITGRVRVNGKLSKNQHIKSLGFGLAMGCVTLFILMFSFFNQQVIAPFITPSKNVSATPLILDPNSDVVGNESKLIIPKINVELPVIFDVETIDESAIQKGLEDGVVHYATTENPGEKGNGAIFGHSSNNILNRGDYKFAFVLLNRLENGDIFYIEKGGVRYSYKVFDRRIVTPTQTEVLDDVPGKTSTMALITCDPPGTDTNRLVVWGEQISPDPTKNGASTAIKTDDTPPELASNAESLWSRMTGWIF